MRGIFTLSAWDSDVEKSQELPTARLTTASASENVGCTLAYHAAGRSAWASAGRSAWALSVTPAERPNQAGVVRRIAKSFGQVLSFL